MTKEQLTFMREKFNFTNRTASVCTGIDCSDCLLWKKGCTLHSETLTIYNVDGVRKLIEEEEKLQIIANL